MDNASVHVLAVKELDDKLKHTKVVFLPKNTTAHTQPLDAGIIQTFKLGYFLSVFWDITFKPGHSLKPGHPIAYPKGGPVCESLLHHKGNYVN